MQRVIAIFQAIAIFQVKMIYGPQWEKTCLQGFANNTGADQPAHPRRLISAFLIRVLESTISKLATREISVFQSGFVGNPENRFCRHKAHI